MSAEQIQALAQVVAAEHVSPLEAKLAERLLKEREQRDAE
jgi:hypothetical protein